MKAFVVVQSVTPIIPAAITGRTDSSGLSNLPFTPAPAGIQIPPQEEFLAVGSVFFRRRSDSGRIRPAFGSSFRRHRRRLFGFLCLPRYTGGGLYANGGRDWIRTDAVEHRYFYCRFQ